MTVTCPLVLPNPPFRRPVSTPPARTLATSSGNVAPSQFQPQHRTTSSVSRGRTGNACTAAATTSSMPSAATEGWRCKVWLCPPYRVPALSMIDGPASATLHSFRACTRLPYLRPGTDRSAGTARQHTGRSPLMSPKKPSIKAAFSSHKMLTLAWPSFTKLPPHEMQATVPLRRSASPAPLAAWLPASSQPKPVLSTSTKRDSAMGLARPLVGLPRAATLRTALAVLEPNSGGSMFIINSFEPFGL